MKQLSLILSIFLVTLFQNSVFAQGDSILTDIPTTREEFAASEKKVLATINWMENSPLDQDEALHKSQYALLLAWITNSPTVTIEINSNVLTFTDKNAQLIMFFMAGWTRYSLLNGYSKDAYQGTLAGLRCAIEIYKKGAGLKKDKNMQKIVDLDAKGELENWVKEQLAKK